MRNVEKGKRMTNIYLVLLMNYLSIYADAFQLQNLPAYKRILFKNHFKYENEIE